MDATAGDKGFGTDDRVKVKRILRQTEAMGRTVKGVGAQRYRITCVSRVEAGRGLLGNGRVFTAEQVEDMIEMLSARTLRDTASTLARADITLLDD